MNPAPGDPVPLERTLEAYGRADAELRVAHHDSAAPAPARLRTREQREAEESSLLAPEATRAQGAGTRVRPEDPDPLRTCFERDMDRVRHSTAFRRLAGKCQVHVAPEDDHLRTRLTHAIEVAQVAGGIAVPLGLNATLAEAAALAHDVGHGPGGHASEEAMSVFVPGGVHDHAVYGADAVLAPLNLTAEVVDGVRQHSWKLAAPATPEGEVVSWADRIAYVAHDFDDAVRAGVVTQRDLPDEVARTVGRTQREQLSGFIGAVLTAAQEHSRLGMVEPYATALDTFRRFNYERIYLRDESRRQAELVIEVLRRLVEWFVERPEDVPAVASGELPRPEPGSDDAMQLAVFHVVGMTDRYALRCAQQLLDWPTDKMPQAA